MLLRVPRGGAEPAFGNVSSEKVVGITGTRPTLKTMTMKAVVVLRTTNYRINKGLVEGPSVFRVWADVEGAKGSRKRVH